MRHPFLNHHSKLAYWTLLGILNALQNQIVTVLQYLSYEAVDPKDRKKGIFVILSLQP
jgi:hypothetical protein